MQFSRLMMLIVLLPVLLSSLEIQLAEGVKCYTCSGCIGKEDEGTDCEEGYNLCVEAMNLMTASNKTRTDRFCSDKAFENQSSQLGLTCDVFRPLEPGSTILARHCFCRADLCNYMLPSSILTTTTTAEDSSVEATNDASLITGFSTLLQLLSVYCTRLLTAWLIK